MAKSINSKVISTIQPSRVTKLVCRSLRTFQDLRKNNKFKMEELQMRNKDRIIIGALAALLMATLLSNIGLIMRDISHCSCPNAAVLQ